MKTKLFALLLCLIVLLSGIPAAHADSVPYTVAQVESLCDGIVAFKAAQSGDDGAQAWLNDGLCEAAGTTAEFYVIGLSQWGDFDCGAYEKSLLRYLETHEVYSASSRLKYALALSASGSTDRYIADTADEAIGELGLMSLVFGLHLLNNGYESRLYSTDRLIGEILSRQLSDGGWAVIGSSGDVDVTAMVLQALAPHTYRSDVWNAVSAGVDLLSRLQQDSGAFKGMGVENCESTAQVLTALSDLGIDAQRDGRFIKNGRTVLDGMLQYRNADGSFSHVGGGFNESATVQAFYSLVAYLRSQYGQSPLYVLDHAAHSVPGTPKENNPVSHSPADSQRDNDDDPQQAQNEQSPSAKPNATQSATIAATQTVGTVAPTELPAVKPTYGGFQPAATADQEKLGRTATADQTGNGGYKLYAVLGILGAGVVACLILFLLKKRSGKNFIAVAILVAVGVLFVLLTNFQSARSYHEDVKEDGDFTVTMTIRCDTILGREKKNRYIPDDGIVLEETEFSATEGETVFDVLIDAAKHYGVPVDNRGAQGAAYIAAINYLYEFDYGDLSGWMYRVNGKFPDVGCQSCYLSPGDRIEWLYTTDIGHDLD